VNCEICVKFNYEITNYTPNTSELLIDK